MARFDLSELKNIPIAEVVGKFDNLLRKGCHEVAHCPWHEDNHPSLTLYNNDGENRCYCFACQNGGSVIDYVMSQMHCDFKTACEWLSREFSIGDATYMRYKPMVRCRRKAVTPEPSYFYIPEEYMMKTVSAKSSFCQCLMKLFPAHLVEHVAEEYRLGMLEDDSLMSDVIFWNIDNQGRVCNGKVQRYDTDIDSERFFHCDRRVVYWLGKSKMMSDIVPKEAVLNNKCLFGEHLLRERPADTIALVESPKNALLGACFVPQHIWIATGNKGNLSRLSLAPLRNRNVIVYPDRDAISDWKLTLDGMKDLANFHVSEFCERLAPSGAKKYDIADYIIDVMRKHDGKAYLKSDVIEM